LTNHPPGGAQRLNLGGKALTNLLKETVSYRSLNMAEEGYLMETVKDALCWVSQVGRWGWGGGVMMHSIALEGAMD
jgi:hypothetical protein